jgi:hypothetical protein
MPIPLVADQDRQRIAFALEEMARLVLRIATDPSRPAPPVNLGSIADRLERVDKLLEAGVEGGGVKPAQIRAIGTQFEGVARALRPAQRRAATTRASRTTKRATSKRATTRKPTRRRSGGR